MSEYKLGFISDEQILKHVKQTVESYRFETNLKTFNKNLVDPIKMTFDSKIYGFDTENGVKNEVLRQVDKTNSNLIGYFHQNIFKYLNSDWEIPKKGFDIVNNAESIVVEMKNKHNTMNSGSSQKVYMSMQNQLLKNSNSICMLVEVIAKKSQNSPWVVSVNGESMKNEKIRRVSIDKFYELVTGDPNAFKNLCQQLPNVIDDAVKISQDRQSINTVMEELMRYSKNTLESLYLLSFDKYQGFDDFSLEIRS